MTPDEIATAKAELGEVSRRAADANAVREEALDRRRELVVALAEAKVPQRDIAEAAGVTVKAIEQVLITHRRKAAQQST